MRLWFCALIVSAVAASGAASNLIGLDASGPAPEYAEKMMLFGQFVGDWDLDYAAYLPDGSTVKTKGEWHWGWGLNGRAVVDVFICPSRAERLKAGAPPGEWGQTIRYYDPKSDAWQVVFAGPAYNQLNVFTARKVGDEIVMEGKGPDAKSRWIFSEITPQSFHWRAVTTKDGGATWKLQEEMFLRRAKSVTGSRLPVPSHRSIGVPATGNRQPGTKASSPTSAR